MSKINKDIECLIYILSHSFSTGGSVERLSRMIKIGHSLLIILIILIILAFVGK